MPYCPTWTSGDAAGRVQGGLTPVLRCDLLELAAAANRRRLLAYADPAGWLAGLPPGDRIHAAPLLEGAAACNSLRNDLRYVLLEPACGVVPGDPPSPSAMAWLWPDGPAENLPIAFAALMVRINGSPDWTDPPASVGSRVRAPHVNELRAALELLRRGRWTLPIYWPGGLLSQLPDTAWFGGLVANTGADELRTVGLAALALDGPAIRGLTGVTPREASRVDLTADTDCTVELYRCCRAVDFAGSPPTWNRYNPSALLDWTTPGGVGAGDAQWIGAAALEAGVPASLAGAALNEALSAMIDGQPQNFLLRRSDSGPEAIAVRAQLVVEFDLDSPPN